MHLKLFDLDVRIPLFERSVHLVWFCRSSEKNVSFRPHPVLVCTCSGSGFPKENHLCNRFLWSDLQLYGIAILYGSPRSFVCNGNPHSHVSRMSSRVLAVWVAAPDEVSVRLRARRHFMKDKSAFLCVSVVLTEQTVSEITNSVGHFKIIISHGVLTVPIKSFRSDPQS